MNMEGAMVMNDEPGLVLRLHCNICRRDKEMTYIGSTPLETESIDTYRCGCGNDASVLRDLGY